MPVNADSLELHMLSLINGERTSRGLDPLQLETNLNLSAELHSQWMLDRDIFSHTGQNGSSATDRIDAEFNLSGSWRTAENIAIQTIRGEPGLFDDVEDLHTSLMNSPGHRANLLDPDLEYVGLRIRLDDFTYSSGTYESLIVTQNFATTSGVVSLDPAVLSGPPNPEPAPDPAPEPAPDPTPAPAPTQPSVRDPGSASAPSVVVQDEPPAPEVTTHTCWDWDGSFEFSTAGLTENLSPQEVILLEVTVGFANFWINLFQNLPDTVAQEIRDTNGSDCFDFAFQDMDLFS